MGLLGTAALTTMAVSWHTCPEYLLRTWYSWYYKALPPAIVVEAASSFDRGEGKANKGPTRRQKESTKLARQVMSVVPPPQVLS